ncbi:MAG: hypothetical protein K8I00_11175, partial [Candidatus Omnitrophica bacterium]|nr:hypothetical protein [Candidatus Omnitrophota bacterium]
RAARVISVAVQETACICDTGPNTALIIMRFLPLALLLAWGLPASSQSAPLLTEHARLTSTVPSQLNIVKTNINRGHKNLRLFELTKIYEGDGSEHEVLSVSITGQLRQDWRELKKRDANIYDLKGAVEQALRRAGISGLRYKLSDDSIFQQNLGITVSLGNRELGKIGVLRQDILSKWGIKNTEVLSGQVRIPFDAAHTPESRQFSPLSHFPAVSRDVSLAVDQKVTYQEIIELINREAGELLKDVTFSEEYLGDKISAGQRGLVFSLCYQSAVRTLTEDEVNAIHQRLLSKMTETFSVVIR